MKINLILLLLVPSIFFGDQYDEALKFEAYGNIEKFDSTLISYFDKNINNEDQKKEIDRLLYSASLYKNKDETINQLKRYVKYIRSESSRQKIYNAIAQIYDLLGEILNAGLYFEKAAYVVKNSINYSSLLNSIELLMELGYISKALIKLEKLEFEFLSSIEADQYYFLLARCNYLLGDRANSLLNIEQISKPNSATIKLSKDLGLESSTNDIFFSNSITELKTPISFIGIKSVVSKSSVVGLDNNSESEINLGSYKSKDEAAGFINILEQIGIEWYFDFDKIKGYTLYIFTDNRSRTLSELDELGIKYKD